MLSSLLSALAQDLTGDEILARVSDRGVVSGEGSQVSRISFDLVFSDGSNGHREFAFFGSSTAAGADKLLIYFLEPELECGTMFLSIDPADPEADTNLWLFLSGLGRVKQLVSDADRNASFAGSNFSNDQLGGGFDLGKDYLGTLAGEEEVEVEWLGQSQKRSAFRVTLEQRPEADVDFPTGTVWVDREEFTILRAEFNNSAGIIEQTITPNDFAEFDGDLVANRIEVANVLDGSATTVATLERN